jgi:hypothetical protein
LEVEDTNLIQTSEDIPGGVNDIYISPDGNQNADQLNNDAVNTQVNFLTGSINEPVDYFVSCFINFETLTSNRGFQLALYDLSTSVSSNSANINNSFLNKWTRIFSKRSLQVGQSFDRVRFNGYNNGIGDIYGLWGCSCSFFNTSYIKTTSSPVTRPSDIYTALGAITGTSYTIYKELNGNKIADYYHNGNKSTYINGVFDSTVSEAPSNDLTLSSEGSDTLLAVAVKEGTTTEAELIEMTT